MAELLEAGHLASPVVSQARSQEGRNVLHLPHDSFKGVLGRAAIHLAQDHEAGLSLGEHADGGAVAGVLDEIALPVPCTCRFSISAGWCWKRSSCGTKLRFEASVARRRPRSGLCRVSRI